MKKTLALFLALLMTLSLGLALMEAPGSALDDYLKPREDIRNIIILSPDGMSPGGITLARWYKSYQADTDSYDPSVTLALDEMASGVIRTYWQTASVLGAITDSAPAGTALVTTALEPTLAPAAIVIGPRTLAPAPITTPSSRVGWRLPLFQEVPPSVTP